MWFLIDAAKLRFYFENQQYFSDFFTEKALSETIFAILIKFCTDWKEKAPVHFHASGTNGLRSEAGVVELNSDRE